VTAPWTVSFSIETKNPVDPITKTQISRPLHRTPNAITSSKDFPLVPSVIDNE